MTEEIPSVTVLAGPNGAGKSTVARTLLRDKLQVTEFVNADVIAQGLSGFSTENVELQAGRIMLDRLRYLAERQISFSFETTLASRSLVPWLRRLLIEGYEFHLVYVWIPSPHAAVSRVANRVRLGGHNVPEATILRRYERSLRNFFQLYKPLATTWQMYDNSSVNGVRLIATGCRQIIESVADVELWHDLVEQYGDAP
ncbi:MAG: AAA family ATPase [Planctomycetaceae bacterium]